MFYCDFLIIIWQYFIVCDLCNKKCTDNILKVRRPLTRMPCFCRGLGTCSTRPLINDERLVLLALDGYLVPASVGGDSPLAKLLVRMGQPYTSTPSNHIIMELKWAGIGMMLARIGLLPAQLPSIASYLQDRACNYESMIIKYYKKSHKPHKCLPIKRRHQSRPVGQNRCFTALKRGSNI